MDSPFNPNAQAVHMDGRIIASLERIAEAFRVLLWRQTRATGLSPIQIQLLIFLLYHPQERRRVSYLAQEFNLTKATISEAVKTLLTKKIVRKEADPDDSRSFTIHLTPKGEKLAKQASAFADEFRAPLERMDKAQKENFSRQLLTMIHRLQESGVISFQRMCHTCRHLEKSSQGQNCAILMRKLQENDLRLDCPVHEPQRS